MFLKYVQDIGRHCLHIADMDAFVGELLRELDQDGLTGNTIIIHTSDHGGVNPRSRRFLYDEGLHVPLIISSPPRCAHLFPPPGTRVVLAVSAILLAVVLSLVASLVWVARTSRWLDLLAGAAVTLAVSVPSFVTGVLGVLLFAIVWPVLPSGGLLPDGFFADPGITAQYLLLPATCLALPAAATLTRFLSEALRDEWEQPYVLTARALGTPRWRSPGTSPATD